MAPKRGADTGNQPTDRTALGRTASALTDVVFAPVWLVLWLQSRLRSEDESEAERADWFTTRPIPTRRRKPKVSGREIPELTSPSLTPDDGQPADELDRLLPP